MVEDVKLILSKSVSEVIATPLTITLLRTYSKLYIGGGQPRCCARSQREYYRKLQNNGLELAELYDNAMNRTFKLNYKGLINISHPKKGQFSLNTELISDEMAIEFLTIGIFQEENFTVLPKGYKFEAPKEIIETENKEFEAPKEEIKKPELKKRGRKSK